MTTREINDGTLDEIWDFIWNKYVDDTDLNDEHLCRIHTKLCELYQTKQWYFDYMVYVD